MTESIIVLVAGTCDTFTSTTKAIKINTNMGPIMMEFINRVNQQYDDIFHHDYTIMINGSVELDTININHSGYKRKDTILSILRILVGETVIINSIKIDQSYRPYKYLDSVYCYQVSSRTILDYKVVKQVNELINKLTITLKNTKLLKEEHNEINELCKWQKKYLNDNYYDKILTNQVFLPVCLIIVLICVILVIISLGSLLHIL